MAGLTREFTQTARIASGAVLGWSLVRLGIAESARKDVLAAQGVSCISFHDPSPLLFERCIRWLLGNGFSFISEDDIIAIAEGRTRPGAGAAWVSLDDGWRGNLDLLPVIERYRVPVTIFLATDAVENLGLFWWTCVYDHRAELPDPLRRSVLRIWGIPETERRELVEPLVRGHVGEYTRQALTIDEVQSLAESGLVSFGSHTVRHPSLPQCDAGQLEEELRDSKDSIEAWTGRPVKSLAYPRNQFDGRERTVLVRCGYELAATVEERAYRPGLDDAYFVPRLAVGEDSFFSANICKMVGAWRPYVGWVQRPLSIVRPCFHR